MFRVPSRFADRTFETFDGSVAPASGRALAAARAMADGSISSLVLSGPTGAGKTHLAAAVLRSIDIAEDKRASEARTTYIREHSASYVDDPMLLPSDYRTVRKRIPTRKPGCLWVNVADLVVGLRMEFGSKDRPLHEQIEDLRSCPSLVVLDDLGRERTSDWTAEVLYSVINGRYEAMFPTLVTTNLTGDDLTGSVYWPAVSRLIEGGALVALDAPDRRTR